MTEELYIDFEAFIRLYVNHRPVFGINKKNIENAFQAIGADLVSGTNGILGHGVRRAGSSYSFRSTHFLGGEVLPRLWVSATAGASGVVPPASKGW